MYSKPPARPAVPFSLLAFLPRQTRNPLVAFEMRSVNCEQNATHYWHHIHTENDPSWTIRGKTDIEIRTDTENAKKSDGIGFGTFAYKEKVSIISSKKKARTARNVWN